MRLPARALLAFAILLLLLPSTVQAEESRPVVARLVWRAPAGAGCISAFDLERAVETRLRRRVFGPRPDVVVDGLARRTGDAWTVTLEMKTTQGELVGTREMESDVQTCDELSESLALVVALMIDVTEEAIRLQIPVPLPPARPPAGWRVETTAGGAAALGFLPGFSFGLHVGLAVDPPWTWPVAVDGVVWADERTRDPRGGVGLEARQAALSVCPPLLRRRLALSACAGGGAVAIRATGFDFRENDDQAAVVPFVSAGLRGSFLLAGPLHLAAGLAGTAPLVRPRFVYDDPTGAERLLYRLPPFAGTATLGFLVAIP